MKELFSKYKAIPVAIALAVVVACTGAGYGFGVHTQQTDSYNAGYAAAEATLRTAESEAHDAHYAEGYAAAEAAQKETQQSTPTTVPEQQTTKAKTTNTDSSGGSGNYAASSQSDKFHYPSCRYVKQINSGNLIYFSSRDKAISAGYIPCKVCRP